MFLFGVFDWVVCKAEYKAFSDRAESAEKRLEALTKRIATAEKMMSSGIYSKFTPCSYGCRSRDGVD